MRNSLLLLVADDVLRDVADDVLECPPRPRRPTSDSSSTRHSRPPAGRTGARRPCTARTSHTVERRVASVSSDQKSAAGRLLPSGSPPTSRPTGRRPGRELILSSPFATRPISQFHFPFGFASILRFQRGVHCRSVGSLAIQFRREGVRVAAGSDPASETSCCAPGSGRAPVSGVCVVGLRGGFLPALAGTSVNQSDAASILALTALVRGARGVGKDLHVLAPPQRHDRPEQLDRHLGRAHVAIPRRHIHELQVQVQLRIHVRDARPLELPPLVLVLDPRRPRLTDRQAVFFAGLALSNQASNASTATPACTAADATPPDCRTASAVRRAFSTIGVIWSSSPCPHPPASRGIARRCNALPRPGPRPLAAATAEGPAVSPPPPEPQPPCPSAASRFAAGQSPSARCRSPPPSAPPPPTCPPAPSPADPPTAA